MSKKISNCFKVVPKKSKVEKTSSNSFEIRDCKVVLQNIIKVISNGELSSLKIDTRKSKVSEIEENENNSKKNSEITAKSSQIRQNLSSKSSIKTILKQEQDLLNNCHFCEQKFASSKVMRIHMTKMHRLEVKQIVYECDFDGKIFKSRRNLVAHMEIHKLKVNCKICQKMYLPRSLQLHIQNGHTTELNEQCKICLKYYKSKQSLSLHKKFHDKRFKCQICHKMFVNQCKLKIHFEEIHENPKSFECEICGRKFNNKYVLGKHQKIHDNNRLKPYKCQKCEFATDDNRSFNYHQNSHEKQEKKFAAMKNPLKCQKCPKLCKDKISHALHIKFVHPKELFQCDLCGKYLKAKSYLRNHIIYKACRKSKILTGTINLSIDLQ